VKKGRVEERKTRISKNTREINKGSGTDIDNKIK
jgi:hypothetical protein